jgi:hypothetical protein
MCDCAPLFIYILLFFIWIYLINNQSYPIATVISSFSTVSNTNSYFKIIDRIQ